MSEKFFDKILLAFFRHNIYSMVKNCSGPRQSLSAPLLWRYFIKAGLSLFEPIFIFSCNNYIVLELGFRIKPFYGLLGGRDPLENNNRFVKFNEEDTTVA